MSNEQLSSKTTATWRRLVLKAVMEHYYYFSPTGVYVLSISTGGNEADQVYAGFFGNLSAQVHNQLHVILS